MSTSSTELPLIGFLRSSLLLLALTLEPVLVLLAVGHGGLCEGLSLCIELLIGDAFGTTQVGCEQVGIAQIGLAQVGTAQVGIAQVGIAQVGCEQVGIAQVGTAQVGIAQVGTAQVGTTESNDRVSSVCALY